jgi:pyridoxal phosphate enzyme (YggS family)
MNATEATFDEAAYRRIQGEIAAACHRVKRDPTDVTLVGVTKTKPASAIREAQALGLCDFGENYVQEFLSKQNEVSDLALRWHFIGHLQSNKAKQVVGRSTLIHSLDSLSLAQALDKEAGKTHVTQDCLLQIHLGKEETKFGIELDQAIKALKDLSALKHVAIRGFMTLPPPAENPEDMRVHFKTLRELRDQANRIAAYPNPLVALSMGMSQDYIVAVEEGATHVRIGTALFGQR